MADITLALPMPWTPPRTGASAESVFADSAIMDMTTPNISPQSKPQFESDQLESEANMLSDQTMDDTSEQSAYVVENRVSSNEFTPPDQATKIVHNHQNNNEAIPNTSSDSDLKNIFLESDASTESDFEGDPELVSHLTTTVSSLRLRHQEQSHLNTLFSSKLEALAQRSLEHEASIRFLTAELESLRNSNTELGRENAMLAHENNDLRIKMQDMKGEVVEREIAMEAMTGAVRGLEGWIESANNSPRPNSERSPLQGKARHRRAGSGVIRGKGRFRGRYHLGDDDYPTDANGGLGMDGSTDVDTTEIQEGVMAWVRGFKDVEEGLKARSESDGRVSTVRQVNGIFAGDQSNNTTSAFDEDFGDFESGG